MKYSILITTYHKRFEEWLKPLIIEIKRQRPDIEIIVSINGELNYFNEDFRASILDFLKDYKNTFPTIFPRFRSLSRMWNLGVQFATEDVVLVLSDDISLEEGFFDQYENVLRVHQTFAINLSFSVFSVLKKDLASIEWFDERLLGLGWEDGDFMRKMERLTGNKLANTLIDACKNCADPRYYKVYNKKLEDCLKNEVRLEGQVLDKEFSRYSEFNKNIHDSKLPPINPYPLEQFYQDNKHRL